MAEDEDIALEVLQAQVDVSLAFTQNLVSSWLKPIEGKLPSSSSRGNEEKELEEYMRRPPRLGVGAAIPESTSLLSRDSARLKSKLSASGGKKRAREDDGPAPALPSDDEEESKANVIKKKLKLDPFAPKDKSKKRVPSTPKALHEHPSFRMLHVEDGGVAAVATAPTDTPHRDGQSEYAADISATPCSTKKKKKKKGRQSVSQLVIERLKSPSAESREQPGGSASNMGAATPEHPRTSPKVELATETSPSSPVKQESPVPTAPPTSPIKSMHTPIISLLNLSGPPPNIEATLTSPSKKKRRRKKKKKKAILQEEQPITEEGELEGSE